MKTQNELRTLLRSIDHKGYPAYKSLAGAWKFDRYTLVIDHVQGDPFASPSSLHVEIAHKDAGFPAATYSRDCSRIALQDFLTRKLSSLFGAQRLPHRQGWGGGALSCGLSGLRTHHQCGRAGQDTL